MTSTKFLFGGEEIILRDYNGYQYCSFNGQTIPVSELLEARRQYRNEGRTRYSVTNKIQVSFNNGFVEVGCLADTERRFNLLLRRYATQVV